MEQISKARIRNPKTQYVAVSLLLSSIFLLQCSEASAFLVTPTSNAVFRMTGESNSKHFSSADENNLHEVKSEAMMKASAAAASSNREDSNCNTIDNTTPTPPLATAPSEIAKNVQQDFRRQQQPPHQLQPQDIMRLLGTSPRRLFLGTLSATGIALAGNFLGVTSGLLMLVPESTVEATGLDTYFPRGAH
jgi:hypothetical protein